MALRSEMPGRRQAHPFGAFLGRLRRYFQKQLHLFDRGGTILKAFGQESGQFFPDGRIIRIDFQFFSAAVGLGSSLLFAGPNRNLRLGFFG